MKKIYFLASVALLFFLGCKKSADVDDTPNTEITMDGDVITVASSPISNPHKMEIYGFAVNRKDLATFNKQLNSNQYGFKVAKGEEMVDYDAMWEKFYARYAEVMRTHADYIGGAITLDVTTGKVTVAGQSIRVRELGYIFTPDKKIPIGSGIATLLNAKVDEEYYVVWLLVTHGTTDEHDLVTITHLNKEPAMQERSVYRIVPRK